MVEVMYVMMLVITMCFASTQRHFVHLNHSNFHMQILVDWPRQRWAARIKHTMWINSMSYNLQIHNKNILNDRNQVIVAL